MSARGGPWSRQPAEPFPPCRPRRKFKPYVQQYAKDEEVSWRLLASRQRCGCKARAAASGGSGAPALHTRGGCAPPVLI